ncbi:MAG: hypothetical protein Q8K64_14190 [Sediminibacterium sp.]|nr:hypothetical protein [Sediminibacterium sp.]
MSSLAISACIIGFIRIVKYVLDTSFPVKNDEASIASVARIAEPKQHEAKTPIRKYYEILSLNSNEPICIEDVKDAYYKQLEQIREQRKFGIVSVYELKEYEAAKDFLIDFCDYGGNRN